MLTGGEIIALRPFVWLFRPLLWAVRKIAAAPAAISQWWRQWLMRASKDQKERTSLVIRVDFVQRHFAERSERISNCLRTLEYFRDPSEEDQIAAIRILQAQLEGHELLDAKIRFQYFDPRTTDACLKAVHAFEQATRSVARVIDLMRKDRLNQYRSFVIEAIRDGQQSIAAFADADQHLAKLRHRML